MRFLRSAFYSIIHDKVLSWRATISVALSILSEFIKDDILMFALKPAVSTDLRLQYEMFVVILLPADLVVYI